MVTFLAGIPVVVWMPFWIMAFGIGEMFKLGLVAIGTFFLVHVHTFQAVRSLERGYVELADVYEKTYWERVRHIFVPASLPSVLTGVRISLAIGWIVLFFVEYAASERGFEGLGWFIADARAVGRVEDEFAGLLLLGIVAYTVDLAVAVGQRYSMRWVPSLAERMRR
jgi:sulfonate transport system permease protein